MEKALQASDEELRNFLADPESVIAPRRGEYDAAVRLKELEDGHVDQVILLNQAGKNTHQDICDSLELFAKEVMPEVKARDDEQQEQCDGLGRLHL